MGNCSKVVVGQDHFRCLLGRLGPLETHGHPDIGPFQRRCVVDSVPGHVGDLAAGLQRLHQVQDNFTLAGSTPALPLCQRTSNGDILALDRHIQSPWTRGHYPKSVSKKTGAAPGSPDSMVAGDHLDANVERIIPEEYNFAIGSRSEQMLP